MLLLKQKFIKNSVRIKAPNSVNASERIHKKKKKKKIKICNYKKQRRVLMANSTVGQSKWKPIVEPRQAGQAKL